MKKIILTKGLPGSGKSTWAKQYQAENPNSVRVNKDDLRAMLHNSVWSKGREEFVLKIRDLIVEEALKAGHDVIVDDTNLHSKHKNQMWKIAAANNATIEEKSFLDVSIEECIKRDLKRTNSVGEKVIKKMYTQYLKPTPPIIEYKKGLPQAIICDIDGTLALFGNKNPYERDFENDKANPAVLDLLQRIDVNNFNGEGLFTRIIFISGRKEDFRGVTRKWLDDLGFNIYPLFMRPFNDNRKDVIIKSEIYEKEIKHKYNVILVLDDRDQVVEFWRSQGLTCLQVNYGDF
jgi:predicted kinase